MKPWLVFLLSGGVALSGAAVGSATNEGHPVISIETLFCFVYAMWFFVTLRFITNQKSISVMMTIGWILSAGFVLINMPSMWLSTLTTAWLWLMHKDFYIGRMLARRPLIDAVTHQIIFVPFCLLMAGTMGGQAIGWSLAALGSFFTYEVSQNLDPYLSVYRRQGTFLIIAMLFAVSLIGARSIGYQMWMSPWAILTLISYSLLWLKPTAFKVIEGVATVSLIFHIWSPLLNFLVGWGR